LELNLPIGSAELMHNGLFDCGHQTVVGADRATLTSAIDWKGVGKRVGGLGNPKSSLQLESSILKSGCMHFGYIGVHFGYIGVHPMGTNYEASD
jgi:hypothetical protein